MKDRIELSDVVLLGRTFEEYCRYFQLSDVELRHATTLDLGAGVSSFSAEARDRGYVVLAADPHLSSAGRCDCRKIRSRFG